MRRLLPACLAACLLFNLSACCLDDISVDEVLDGMEGVVSGLGNTQITKDWELIGSRERGEDAYVGTYAATCQRISDRDVVFGGASIQERNLKVSGNIVGQSGTATIRIRLGETVTELSCDENGYFETEISLCGGGNYIMVIYENFTGEVSLTSEYIRNGTA